jgi:beta-1,4-mannosyl-glycoprotein beta-1,4-N-acetylglucosaminyltransferase
MIYDCFTFFNELDLLEIRLEELYNTVDYFVICESTITHTGKSKSLNYLNNSDRYKKYADKIRYVIHNNNNNQIVNNPWTVENDQRRFLINGIKTSEVNDKDVIMISDLDEIPNSNFLKNLFLNINSYSFPLTIGSQLFYGKLTHKVVEPSGCSNWGGTVLVDGKTFKEQQDFQFYRDYRNNFTIYKDTGSWHFSYMGGENIAMEKIISFAHSEFNTEDVRKNIYNRILKCEDPLGRSDIRLEKVIIDKSFPVSVLDNIEKYSRII